VLAFVAALLLVPMARRVALRFSITNHPSPERWHEVPTPYLGGIGLALAFLAASPLVEGWDQKAVFVVATAFGLSVLGLVDDLRALSPPVRLLVEAVAGVVAFSAGCRTHLGPDAVDLVVTVVAIVVVTNAFNLLDNIDGALGAVATVTGVGIGAAALLGGQYLVGGLALALAGGSVGFLVHNWHPASIFLGDAGSLFVGYLLAALTLRLDTAVGPFEGAVASALLVGPALFDTTLVMVSRARGKRSLLVGGTDHTSHRLVRHGLDTRVAVALIAVASAACSATGVAVARGEIPAAWAAALAVVVGVPILVVLLASADHAVVQDADEPRAQPGASPNL
jgi:UDP-GlcNAc:undecaprenyl-phosphate GlcNAc-1-phosphate transferase